MLYLLVKRVSVTLTGVRMTINDIAKLSGVSTTTVSRVLNKIPSVKRKTCRQINKIISQLNYKPNPFAQALAKMRKEC